jgi:hypothetical protein
MRTSVGLACVLTLLAMPAAAQSSTEDGIRAVLRGDYHAAVRILRPLAEDAARPDPVAQFFLAVLYDSGHVGGSNARACGLFRRAAVMTNPFSAQSSQLAAALRDELGGGASRFCDPDESWQGGPAQSFALGPGHKIVFADTSIRVNYGDREQVVLLGPLPGGAPIQVHYTPLSVTRPTAARRHFFQWFWTRKIEGGSSSWALGWTLSEVVGERWIPITSEEGLAVANDPASPLLQETAKVAFVQLNATGEAEFVVTAGRSPRTEVIPHQGEPARPTIGQDAEGANTVAAGRVAGPMGSADGVSALARGDHQKALEILQPIAEPWGTRDATAQFVLAGLYETGAGVPLDPLRACALYMRAGSDFNNPFGREAGRLLGSFMARGQEFSDDCQLLAVLGFDHGFEPVTFHLGPGHSVEWNVRAATVTYRDRTNRAPMAFAAPGSRFLPLKYTELATGPTRSVIRHFVEVFAWSPARQTGSWELHRHLFEVAGDDIVTIDTSGPLATSEGEAPPSRESFAASDYAVVRVDDEGNAEWAILKGPQPMTQRIESEAERRQVREAALARDAALKRVDWSRRYDVARPPAMVYAGADGCGYVQLHGWSADRAEAIVVRVAGAALNLSAQPVTFDLSREVANISVEAYVYASAQQQFSFCSDVGMPSDSAGPQIWSAISGTITIALSSEGVRARDANQRHATVTLNNVVLRNTAGVTVRAGTLRLTALVSRVFG